MIIFVKKLDITSTISGMVRCEISQYLSFACIETRHKGMENLVHVMKHNRY